MKIIFFNRFFFPDTSATSQILSDLAFHLAAASHEIHAVTSRTSREEPVAEDVRGVHIHRVATAVTGPHSLIRRAASYLGYYLGARRMAHQLIEIGDVVVLKTDPPLLSLVVGYLARRKGARVVIWLQDIFPEVAHQYGVLGMGGLSGAALRRMRDRSLDIADRIVVICEQMADQLARTGAVARDRMEVIHNWADGDAIRPVERGENPLRIRWNLEGDFIVGYSGNLGRVHEFDTILEAAALLRNESHIRFLIIGRGPRLEAVQARVARDKLPNVRFEPHQDRDSLAYSLGLPDVHLSVLQPAFEGLVHPSKLYGIMAAGRPTIFIGHTQGETAAILAGTQSGVSVRTGDSEGLATAILAMRDREDVRDRMGKAARRAFDERFARPIALEKWQNLMDSLGYRSS